MLPLTEQTEKQGLQRKWIVLLVTWALAFLVICPVIFHWTAPEPGIWPTRVALLLSFFAGLLVCGAIYRFESKRMPSSYAASLVVLVVVLSLVSWYMHRTMVDFGFYFPHQTVPNYVWQ